MAKAYQRPSLIVIDDVTRIIKNGILITITDETIRKNMEKFIITILVTVFNLVLFVICLIFKINDIWVFILWFVISLIAYCLEYSVRRKNNN